MWHKRTPPIPGVRSLNRQSKLPCHLFKFASLLGREFVGTDLDLNLFKRASKFEWHLRVVLVDDWRSGILTNVETFIEREFAKRRRLLDATLRHFLAIDREGSKTTFAESPAV